MSTREIETIESLLGDWRSHQAEIDRIRRRLQEILGSDSLPISAIAPRSSTAALVPVDSKPVSKPNWAMGSVLKGTKGGTILRIIAKHGGTATIAQIVADFLEKSVWDRSEYLNVLHGIRYITKEPNEFIETVERGKVRLNKKGEATLKWMEANNA